MKHLLMSPVPCSNISLSILLGFQTIANITNNTTLPRKASHIRYVNFFVSFA